MTEEPTDVLWISYHQPEILHRGYWDQALLETTFDKVNFNHHESVDNKFPELEEGKGAVVVINGRTHVEDVDRLNTDIAKLRWILLVVSGDEEATFPWQDVKHPMMRLWVQLPRMNVHNDVSYKLPNGYRPTTRKILAELGQQERTLDWFFAGQINHDRREQCVAELRKLPNGELTETKQFGKEAVEYHEYLKKMASAKIIPCPSGIETPDSFRLYEALEAGCLPVVDAFSTRHQAPGFWQYLFGDDVPFPIIDYWDKFPALLPQLLKEWPSNANRVSAWWQLKKRETYWKLVDDIKELNP